MPALAYITEDRKLNGYFETMVVTTTSMSANSPPGSAGVSCCRG